MVCTKLCLITSASILLALFKAYFNETKPYCMQSRGSSNIGVPKPFKISGTWLESDPVKRFTPSEIRVFNKSVLQFKLLAAPFDETGDSIDISVNDWIFS